MKLRVGFLKRCKKCGKPLTRLTKKKNTEINAIVNEREGIITETTKIQRITGDHYEQLYINKLDNLEEMNKFLKTCSLPCLNHKEMDNLN